MSTSGKICVYAICKNESKNVAQWLAQILKELREDDRVYILDTGSTDDTVKLFSGHEKIDINHAIFSPFRFDHARNTALSMIGADFDFCIRLDLDERLPVGWREIISQYIGKATRLSYQYVWDHMPNGEPGCVYTMNLIHSRANYHYTGATHECLTYCGVDDQSMEVLLPADGLVIHQYASRHKTPHADLKLLEQSVKENRSARHLFYYGRELYYKADYALAIKILDEYLTVSDYVAEMADAHRVLGLCHMSGNLNKARQHFMQSCVVDPMSRDNWLALANFAYRQKDWILLQFAACSGLAIKQRTNHYITSIAAWSFTLYDHAALAAYNLGDFKSAKEYGAAAYSMAQACGESKATLGRLTKNCEFYNKKKV